MRLRPRPPCSTRRSVLREWIVPLVPWLSKGSLRASPACRRCEFHSSKRWLKWITTRPSLLQSSFAKRLKRPAIGQLKLTKELKKMRFFKGMSISGALLAGLASAKEVTTQIPVSGMTCGSCAVAVTKALTSLEGVRKTDVSVEQNKATGGDEDSQVTEKQLREAINKTGFKAEVTK